MIYVCESCNATMFPKRLLCPRCGSRDFRREQVETGTLEDFSDRGDVKLGQVRAQDAILIARVEITEPRRGMQVTLLMDGNTPVARA